MMCVWCSRRTMRCTKQRRPAVRSWLGQVGWWHWRGRIGGRRKSIQGMSGMGTKWAGPHYWRGGGESGLQHRRWLTTGVGSEEYLRVLCTSEMWKIAQHIFLLICTAHVMPHAGQCLCWWVASRAKRCKRPMQLTPQKGPNGELFEEFPMGTF